MKQRIPINFDHESTTQDTYKYALTQQNYFWIKRNQVMTILNFGWIWIVIWDWEDNESLEFIPEILTRYFVFWVLTFFNLLRWVDFYNFIIFSKYEVWS